MFLSPPLLSPRSTVKKNWPESFQVPWEKMPPGINAATTSGKRPSPADRRQMVLLSNWTPKSAPARLHPLTN
uniref:Uncharacterized protein n=1 Tax=Paramormyrops kingsleyae TaxID=1676925 RepID=A0A3B3QH15_9TELE